MPPTLSRLASSFSSDARENAKATELQRIARIPTVAVPLASDIERFGQRRHDEGFLNAEQMLEELDYFKTLPDLLPSTDDPAIYSVDLKRKPLTHARLHSFICEQVRFSDFGIGRNDRVAILLPNGPELAVAFVAVLSYCTCAPLNPASTPQEIKGEVQNVK